VKREPEYFGDRELELVYIAKRLKEALHLEELFTQSGFEYSIETDNYRGGIIFATERIGAFFYVAPESATPARELITLNGMRPWIED
jgi:hypothetical protein